MSFFEHLEELRTRLKIVIAAFIVAFLIVSQLVQNITSQFLGYLGGAVAAGLLLVGTLVSIVLILQRGPTSIAAISLGTIVASLLIVSLSSTVAGRPWSAQLGKWILIAAASLSAVPLVAWASGR